MQLQEGQSVTIDGKRGYIVKKVMNLSCKIQTPAGVIKIFPNSMIDEFLSREHEGKKEEDYSPQSKEFEREPEQTPPPPLPPRQQTTAPRRRILVTAEVSRALKDNREPAQVPGEPTVSGSLLSRRKERKKLSPEMEKALEPGKMDETEEENNTPVPVPTPTLVPVPTLAQNEVNTLPTHYSGTVYNVYLPIAFPFTLNFIPDIRQDHTPADAVKRIQTVSPLPEVTENETEGHGPITPLKKKYPPKNDNIYKFCKEFDRVKDLLSAVEKHRLFSAMNQDAFKALKKERDIVSLGIAKMRVANMMRGAIRVKEREKMERLEKQAKRQQ